MTIRGLHWGHYAIEAWGLGTFMLFAGAVAVALGDVPGTYGRWLSEHGLASRAIFGVAMGTTAASIVYSPWGARSGAHLNPSVTLTYTLLGKLPKVHALAYTFAQFGGGAIGLFIIALARGKMLIGPPVHAIVTRPGPAGSTVAFAAETAISFLLMSVILAVSNATKRISRYTGLVSATCIALFITFEAPLSGMSMNPARTLASALQGHDFTAIWIYFSAPPLGMLLAAAAFVAIRGRGAVFCGRLNHTGPHPCIFDCNYDRLPQ
jgi:aquaporin Z